MEETESLCHGHRFSVAIISGAVRRRYRFELSLRDIAARTCCRRDLRDDPSLVRQIRRQATPAARFVQSQLDRRTHLGHA